MDMNERIKRINELYHKSQKEGLTLEEKEEQNRLRREYIDSVKNSLRGQLDNVDIKEKDGSITNLGEKVKKKRENKEDNKNTHYKDEIRRNLIARRNEMSREEILEKSNIIEDKILILPEYFEADTILLYASYNSEVMTTKIFERALKDGKKVAFPKSQLVDGIPTIEFYYVDSLSMLAEGYKGIMEPDIFNNELTQMTCDNYLCIVPGVAFDKTGYRIGYGKGFYDRFISYGENKKYIGICFESQVIEKVPSDVNDKTVDMIVTEEKTYVCK